MPGSRYGGLEVGDAQRLRELAVLRKRFSYRRLGLLLGREGVLVNPISDLGLLVVSCEDGDMRPSPALHVHHERRWKYR